MDEMRRVNAESVSDDEDDDRVREFFNINYIYILF